jgi:hypothetical protein
VPKLVSQLYEESIFISIGHREFQIPRDLFNDPGNSPNFFSLGFAVFFADPKDIFPGLDKAGLIRPPSIVPPSVPSRSADTFAELLHLLRGYPVHIRNEAHRAALLRDCRYFNFKGLEQRLIPHSLSFNQARGRDEIVLRLEDLLKSGISVAAEPTAADPLAGWVSYARPYVDGHAAELVLEIAGEATRLHLGPPPRAEFFRDARTRVARLFEVIATKLNLPPTTQPLGLLMAKGGAGSQPATPGNTPLSEDLVRIVLDADAAVTLNGKPWNPTADEYEVISQGEGLGAGAAAAAAAAAGDGTSMPPSAAGSPVSPTGGTVAPPPRKRRRVGSAASAEEWIVKTGQWRLRIQGAKNGKAAVECVLRAVKLDAVTSELARNAQRPFLGG